MKTISLLCLTFIILCNLQPVTACGAEEKIILSEVEDSKLIGDTSTRWQFFNIPVCWENPDETNVNGRTWTQRAVENTWKINSDINFTGWNKCDFDSLGIRILIADDGPHVKQLGNKLNGLSNGMVLNFTFDEWEASCKSRLQYCIETIAVHEFGHALGFAHEHNRLDTPPECTKEPQGGDGDVYLTRYDQSSVMNYCNRNWNNGGRLSELDILGLQKWYGFTSNRSPECYITDWIRKTDPQTHRTCIDGYAVRSIVFEHPFKKNTIDYESYQLLCCYEPSISTRCNWKNWRSKGNLTVRELSGDNSVISGIGFSHGQTGKGVHEESIRIKACEINTSFYNNEMNWTKEREKFGINESFTCVDGKFVGGVQFRHIKHHNATYQEYVALKCDKIKQDTK